MMKLALAAARATAFASRATGRGGGTTLPGRVLTALAPDAPRRLAARLPRGCVVVSATNGKTTTCALLAESPARAGQARAQQRGRQPGLRHRIGARRARGGHGRARPVRVRRGSAARHRRAAAAERDRARQPLSRPARPLRRARARGRALARADRRPRSGDDARGGRGRSAHRLARRGPPDGRPLRHRRPVRRAAGRAARGRRALLHALRTRLRLPRRLRRASQRLRLPGLRQRARPARRGRARHQPARPGRHRVRPLPRGRARARRARAARPLQRRERARRRRARSGAR